jgi:hypothetical protein
LVARHNHARVSFEGGEIRAPAEKMLIDLGQIIVIIVSGQDIAMIDSSCARRASHIAIVIDEKDVSFHKFLEV